MRTIEEMWNEGMTLTEIGAVLGKSRSAVGGAISRARAKGAPLRQRATAVIARRRRLLSPKPRPSYAPEPYGPWPITTLRAHENWQCREVIRWHELPCYCAAPRLKKYSYCATHNVGRNSI